MYVATTTKNEGSSQLDGIPIWTSCQKTLEIVVSRGKTKARIEKKSSCARGLAVYQNCTYFSSSRNSVFTMKVDTRKSVDVRFIWDKTFIY